MSNFYETLRKVLLQDERLVAQDGTLLRNYAFELGEKADKNLLQLLLNNKATKKHFFQKVGDVVVFDKREFCWIVNNRQFLPDSYTRFANKIGLVDDSGKLISQTENVQLAFPYKDCLLEGGQTKDDQKRDEVFWNELLSPDECDRLLDPKVLCNAKTFPEKRRQTTHGKQRTEQSPTPAQGLLIKGNNLFALASLVKVYEGKVKLIYIDPPYNTGTDSFLYNDRFNHAAWLTFMKNRLVLAKRMLMDNGSIWIQADDNEVHYLKVLCDEIFGRKNFRNAIYWRRTFAGKTISKNLPRNVDTILFYSKKPDSDINNVTIDLTDTDIASYNKDDNDGRGKYTTVSLQKTGGPGPETTYDYKDNKGKIWKCPAKGWRMKQEKLKALENDNRLYINDNTIREKYYLSERLEIGKQMDNFWHDIGNMNRSKSENTAFVGQKPEKLIQRILEIATQPGDLVLDFFAGSGTTLAVAHKKGRKWIGIEQMDYVESVTVERLNNVLEGEQGGISKSVGWQGGGSFVYCELATRNVAFIDRIGKAKTAAELMALWKEVQKANAYDYKIDIDQVKEDFETLSLADKKRFLIEALDKEMLYVNLSDIDDEDFQINEADKVFTREFYGL